MISKLKRDKKSLLQRCRRLDSKIKEASTEKQKLKVQVSLKNKKIKKMRKKMRKAFEEEDEGKFKM